MDCIKDMGVEDEGMSRDGSDVCSGPCLLGWLVPF